MPEMSGASSDSMPYEDRQKEFGGWEEDQDSASDAHVEAAKTLCLKRVLGAYRSLV